MTPNPSAPDEQRSPVREFTIQLPATRRGAHRARLLAVEQLREWRLPYEDAALVVAELASNAALHGRVPGRDFRLGLRVTPDPRTLRIELTDARGDRLPSTTVTPPSPTAESGRGLLLVAALATHWGATSGPTPTKTLWATLPL